MFYLNMLMNKFHFGFFAETLGIISKLDVKGLKDLLDDQKAAKHVHQNDVNDLKNLLQNMEINNL